MFVTKRNLSRRTVLRGIGATVALPLLDSMIPALTALTKTAAKPIQRFGVVYVPNGVVIDKWTPQTEGFGFDFTPILKPLEPFRENLLVVSGLTQNVNGLTAKSGAVHGRCATKYLTGAIPRPFGQEGSDFRADISIDQLLANELGQETQLGSLELSLESGDKGAGTCDGGYSCPYSHPLTWRGPTTPLPMEHNPRVLFERMFGDGGTTDPESRALRLRNNRSLLDSVTEKIDEVKRHLGPAAASAQGDGLDAGPLRAAQRRRRRRLVRREGRRRRPGSLGLDALRLDDDGTGRRDRRRPHRSEPIRHMRIIFIRHSDTMQ